MSAKKPNDMKNAFQALRVNQPLRLPKEGPGLSPPKRDSTNEAPRIEAPPDGSASKPHHSSEAPQTEVPRAEASVTGPIASEKTTIQLPPSEQTRSEEASNKAAGREEPRKEVPRYEDTPCEVPTEEVTQDGQPRFQRSRKGRTQTELDQDERASRSQIEVPRFEDIESNRVGMTTTGFFKLSHSLFSHPIVQNMSGDCFRLFLWMSARAWRYPDSTGVLRASVRFMEDEIGMGHATISRALKTLKEHQMVQVLDVDYKRGNTWKVSSLALSGSNPSNPDPKPGPRRARDEVPCPEEPRRENVATSKRGDHSLNSRAQPPRIEDHYKNYKNLNKYSQEALRPLLDRVTAFDATRKREAELSSLDSILETFDPRSVQIALGYVDTKGTLRGEKCHSPFSYLSLAIDDVLQRILPKPETSIGSVHASAVFQDTIEPEITDNILRAFEAELSNDAQEAFVAHFRSLEYSHGFLPPDPVLKKLAAAAWFTERSQNSHAEGYQAVG